MSLMQDVEQFNVLTIQTEVQAPKTALKSTIYIIPLLSVNRRGSLILFCSIYSARVPALAAEDCIFGEAGRTRGRGAICPPPPQCQNIRWSVCVRREGGAGARQSITADAHKAHFMGIRQAAV